MPAYRPGQGLNSDALRRLRERKQTAVDLGRPGIPSQDDSRQWASILGDGAAKVPRCGICTRPCKELVCAFCAANQKEQAKQNATIVPTEADDAEELLMMQSPHDGMPNRHLDKFFDSSGCSTPSTEASSEESYFTALDATGDACAVELAWAEHDIWNVVRKGLDGTWLGDGGEFYEVSFHEAKQEWKCTRQDNGKSFTLSLDAKGEWGAPAVYWGRSCKWHTQVSDICEKSDQIEWKPWDSKGKIFNWRRPPVLDSASLQLSAARRHRTIHCSSSKDIAKNSKYSK